MEKKICSKCNIDKKINEFHKNCLSKDGFHSNCKNCRKITDKQRKSKIQAYHKKYNEYNKEIISKKRKKFYDENKKRILNEHKEYYINNQDKIKKKSSTHRSNNKEYYSKYNSSYHKNKALNDNIYKIKHKIKSSIVNSLKKHGYTKSNRTEIILGCKISEFKAFIENKWESWMSWENHGKYNGSLNYGWDLDHIIPISSAKTEEEVIRLNHHNNFQPLCSYTNRYIKRNKRV